MSNLPDPQFSDPATPPTNFMPPQQESFLRPFLLGVGCMVVFGGGLYFLTPRSPKPAESTAARQPSPAAPPAAPMASTAPAHHNDPSTHLAITVQANHANGSTMRLSQLVLSESSITVNITITNGYKEAIAINDHEDMVLIDSSGNQYNLAAPPNNPKITIPIGTTLKGKFVFKGRIAPGVTALTLITNNKFGTDTNFSTNPKMTLNIPLPGPTK
jgi:hypothetical protein